MKRFRMPSPAMILGVIAVVLALAGTAVAAGTLKLADFNQSSRDRLAGAGVVDYSAATSTTAATNGLQEFTVQCPGAKKPTAGGWKWVTTPPPNYFTYRIQGSYPIGNGWKVALFLQNAATQNQPAEPCTWTASSPASSGHAGFLAADADIGV